MGDGNVLGDHPVSRVLRLACIDSEAPPLFNLSPDGVNRTGYEPEVAALVAGELGAHLEWVFTAWENMIPLVQAGDADAVWCGQGMTEERMRHVNFTQPYAIFNETVLVRAGDPARSPADMAGYRVAAIANSTNLALALTFPGIVPVEFGASDDVFGDMIEAVRNGSVDAMVDDDVVTVPIPETDPAFDVAFTVPTRNRWGVGVAKSNDALRAELNAALDAIKADGRLEAVWSRWMPSLPYPFVGDDA
ncbi:amino acid ABC transporter substrate-binding protein (PAAT family) [Microbacteriaceae bacterium MWH-Ta3]|nr:amino acid ABC transporter substrate-binding protein (PAAT family) [Microbacteriaceae bacterium MWH-Ta3]